MRTLRLNVKALLKDLGYTVYERGKNIMRKCIAIPCFKCSSPDPSHHLNIAIDGSFMHCFRCGFHKSGIRNVLEELLGRSTSQGEFVRYLRKYTPSKVEDYQEFLQHADEGFSEDFRILSLWESFSGLRGVDIAYLHKRGISEAFSRRWGLKGGTGEYLFYVMVPVRDLNGKLVGFVGRDITGKSDKRFLNSPGNGIRKHLFGLYECKDKVLRDKYLVLVEGVFDVLKGQQYDLNVVGLLGKKITNNQLQLLVKILSYDTCIFVLLDTDAMEEEKELIEMLTPYFNKVIGLRIAKDGAKDIADLTELEIIKLRQWILSTVTPQSHNKIIPQKVT